MCCLEQVAISQGAVEASRYAEGVLAALEACEQLWVHASSDYSTSLFSVLELLTWHAWRKVHPANTVLLNAMQVTSVAGRHARVPLFDGGRNHSTWLRQQLKKHGAIGHAVVATFLKKARVDVRDGAMVREAFAALEAVAATQAQVDAAERQEHLDARGMQRPEPVAPKAGVAPVQAAVRSKGCYTSAQAPRDHWRADCGCTRPVGDFHYGWIDVPPSRKPAPLRPEPIEIHRKPLSEHTLFPRPGLVAER